MIHSISFLPMSGRRTAFPVLASLLVATGLGLNTNSSAQVLLRDDFNGSGNVNTDVWRLPFDSEGTFVGRTQFRGDSSTDIPQQGIPESTASDGLVAEITLDTFSPIDPGNQFLGTDLLTRRNFARGDGLAFESRLRLAPTSTSGAPLAGGLANGFFTFDVVRDEPLGSGNLVRDEIDFELLSNQTVGAATQQPLTNFFNDDGFDFPDSVGEPQLANVNGLDLTQFQDYRVEWTPRSIQWFVNDQLVRTQTTDVPDDPQQLHFNLWAPGSDFEQAFNAALQPATSAGANQEFVAQIDHAEVRRFNTTTSDNLLTDGSFEVTIAPTPIQNASATATGEWLSFGNVNFVAAGGAANVPDFGDPGVDGLFLASVFGPFNGGPDASGLVQNVAAEPGQEFEASVLAQTLSADSIDGTENFATIQLSFLDSLGQVLQEGESLINGFDTPLLDGRDPNLTQDEFVEGVVNAVAPEGTAFARVSLFFIQLANEGGSVTFEDVSLTLLTPDELPVLQGDFNGDGLVNAADYTVWRDNLGGDESLISDAGDGLNGVDNADYQLFVANFGASASAAAVAVPEPGATLLALVALGSAATASRRFHGFAR